MLVLFMIYFLHFKSVFIYRAAPSCDFFIGLFDRDRCYKHRELYNNFPTHNITAFPMPVPRRAFNIIYTINIKHSNSKTIEHIHVYHPPSLHMTTRLIIF